MIGSKMLPIWISFLLGVLLNSIAAVMSNSATIKSSSYYMYLAAAIGVATTLIWFSMARDLHDPKKILLYGLYWDMIIVGTFIAVPFIYGAKVSTITALGIFMMVAGFILTKVG